MICIDLLFGNALGISPVSPLDFMNDESDMLFVLASNLIKSTKRSFKHSSSLQLNRLELFESEFSVTDCCLKLFLLIRLDLLEYCEC